jgi:hypothetical protein
MVLKSVCPQLNEIVVLALRQDFSQKRSIFAQKRFAFKKSKVSALLI